MGEADPDNEDDAPPWARKMLSNQEKHGEQLDEYGEGLEELSQSVNLFQGDTKDNFTRMGTEFGHLKDRAAEDRQTAERHAKDTQERADRKEKEIEDKVGTAHAKNQETDTALGTLAGEFKNHIDDNHATQTAKTKTALEEHVKNNDRHSGAPPQDGERTQGLHPGVKYGAGGAGGIATLYGLFELIKSFAGS